MNGKNGTLKGHLARLIKAWRLRQVGFLAFHLYALFSLVVGVSFWSWVVYSLLSI